MTRLNEGLSETERIKLRAEGNKLLHDTMKQLITISSGSILIMVTFLERLFRNPQWNTLVVVAFVGFLICIIASLIMMRTIALKMGTAYGGQMDRYQRIETLASATAAGTFLLGLVALVVYLIRNLQLS